MKNLHIEHPEDTILTGDLSVLDAFQSKNSYSVKIDGSPAIVWGTNPENGKFFVGTKSVFNKKTPKINYSNEDIERNHPDIELSGILHRCFNFLPRTEKIYQGDFIGFGGYRDYRPNAISYTFQRITHGGVVIAPHTEYKGETMKGMNASPLEYIPAGQGADFIKPNAWLGTTGSDNDINLLVSFARQVAASIDFATKKEAALIKKDLNAYIRDGDEVVAEEFANYELVRLWLLVKKIKTQYMKLMRDNATYDCFLGESLIGGEGYVMHSKHGVYKLVDRETFSHYNFNIIRS